MRAEMLSDGGPKGRPEVLYSDFDDDETDLEADDSGDVWLSDEELFELHRRECPYCNGYRDALDPEGTEH